MSQVTFGVGLFPIEPLPRMLELTKLAEDVGFSCAYMGDSQMIWREPYVLLGAAAMVTKRITLASGVTNPVTRDLGVLAASWITLRETVGDRVLLGIGTGDSSVETLGKKPSTLANLERSVTILRDLISATPVKLPETGAEVRITYAHSGTHIPVYVAVSSPKIHRLAGKIADGAIVLVGVDPQFLKASREALEAGAAEAGTTLAAKKFRVVCWTPCSILEDGRAARRAVKAHVARVLKRKLPFELDAPTMDVVNKIRQQYDYYSHMIVGTQHGEVVSDELVERFAIAGTPAEAREQLERLAASGLVDEIAVIPHTQDPRDRDRIIRLVGEVIPQASRRA
ncbi:MAG: LLM class flavin-dependent oxidoreductase [Xanthobacteraceae bacterium]